MKLPLTPEMLEAVYEWLRSTSPFRAWGLPHADDIEFRVLLAKDRGAHYRGPLTEDVHPEIGVSVNGIENYCDLHACMAHEMIHLWLDRNGRDDGEAEPHGSNFIKAAKRVCRYHGFELEKFAR